MLCRDLLGVVLVSGACARAEPPAAIAYFDNVVGPGPAQVAQAVIDGWATPRQAEIRLDWIGQRPIRTGDMAEIDLAEAMVTLPGLVAAVGPLSSRATLLVAPIYAERKIPLISATATTRQLQSTSPWVFALAPDDVAEGQFIATFLLQRLHARRVTIFYLITDEYGLGLRQGVTEALRRGGGEPLDEIGITEHSEFPLLVKETLRHGTPDAIVIAARTTEANSILLAVHTQWPDVPLVLGDAASLDPALLRTERVDGHPVYAVNWWQPTATDASSQRFVARFTQAVGRRPTGFDAMHYDALMVAAEAVAAVGPNREAVRRYLSELGGTRPPARGVTGPIAFTANRKTNLVMSRLTDGTTVPVDTL